MLCPKIDENTLMAFTSAKKINDRNQPRYTHFALCIPIEHCPNQSLIHKHSPQTDKFSKIYIING